MKKIINKLLRVFLLACFGLIMPLNGAQPESKPAIAMVTSEDIVILKDIARLASKIMKGKNVLFAQERIQDLMNKLDPALQERIADDIKIIINIGDPYLVVFPKSLVAAAPKRMRESKAAYFNLNDIVKIVEAQEHLIKVAQEAKELVENASTDEKSGAINVALKKIQGATQAAKKSVDHLYSRAENGLKLSEENVFLRINLLREIVDAASLLARPEDRKFKFIQDHNDKKIREEGKKRLVRLMRSNLLNSAIIKTITPDIQILLDTTEETLDASQKAYERLRDMVEGSEKEEKSIIAMIKEGKELVQNAPIGTLQKVSEFVTVQMLNVGELLEDLLEQGARSVNIGARKLLGDKMVFAETYKPYFKKATAMMGEFIGFGWSKMKDLMESVKTFVYNHPIASTVISAYVVRRLIETFNSYVAHYKHFKEGDMYYDKILKKAGDAFRGGDLNTYYTLVGILQDLGISVTEEYDKNIPKGLYLESPNE